MSEIIIGRLHRSVEGYAKEHGTGSLALVKYIGGAFDLVCVENDGLDGYTLLPLAGPLIDDDEIEWLVDVDAMTIGFGEIEV